MLHCGRQKSIKAARFDVIYDWVCDCSVNIFIVLPRVAHEHFWMYCSRNGAHHWPSSQRWPVEAHLQYFKALLHNSTAQCLLVYIFDGGKVKLAAHRKKWRMRYSVSQAKNRNVYNSGIVVCLRSASDLILDNYSRRGVFTLVWSVCAVHRGNGYRCPYSTTWD